MSRKYIEFPYTPVHLCRHQRGTFGTITEPTLTHYYFSKSIVSIWVHTRCTFFLYSFFFLFPFLKLCFFPLPFNPLIPLSTITTLQPISMSPFTFLLNSSTLYIPPQLSACSLSVSLSLFCLLFQLVHQIPCKSEIIWYLSFSDWLISLSIMFSKSIYTAAKGKIFMVEEYSTV